MTNTEPQSVVVGVDGSASSVNALRKAAEYAAILNTALLIITCWKAPNFYTGVVHPQAEIFKEEAKKQQSAAISEAFDNGCPVRASRRLTHGRAAQELIKTSENAQLLVLGTRGHGEFASLILGSVSLECIAHAHPPVLTVRAS